MSRTVLFAGGPLHDQVRQIRDTGTFCVPAMCDPMQSPLDLSAPVQFEQVVYSIGKFVLCGRMIWIGHLGTEPDEDLVFEVLASDGAKAASCAANLAPF